MASKDQSSKIFHASKYGAIRKLDGTNYVGWKGDITAILRVMDALKIARGKCLTPRSYREVASVANPPQSYCEAPDSPLHKHWRSAMQEEYASLMENDAFALVKRTSSKPIGCKWVYKTKH